MGDIFQSKVDLDPTQNRELHGFLKKSLLALTVSHLFKLSTLLHRMEIAAIRKGGIKC